MPADYQFKLYASKFPIWWTHNSIDKPDPTYFDTLNDSENKDGFNWVEVPFTFNYKDQFTGTLIADDQYYTFFKLIDSKDDKFPNKYYLVESQTKSFQGGYELELRLDVFTTYGLDFWKNAIINPDINSKTVTLNRTNLPSLLLEYYYKYGEGILQGDNQPFSNWSYLDPLLKFNSMTDFSILAQWFGKDYYNNYIVPRTYIANKYVYTWSGSGFDQSTTTINSDYDLYGSGDKPMQMLTGVRYYIINYENDIYWLVWTTVPRDWNNTWGYGNNISLIKSENGGDGPSEILVHTDWWAVSRAFIHSTRGFANKIVGVFDGPPLNAVGNFSLALNGGTYVFSNYETCTLSIDGDCFLVTKLYITPDRTSGLFKQIGNYAPNNYFSMLSIMNPTDGINRPAPNTKYGSLISWLFTDDFSIRYLNNQDEIKNNYYILQKAQIYNLGYTPIQPAGIGPKINWTADIHTHTDNISGGLVTREIGRIQIPNVAFVTSSGVRLGTLAPNLGISTTLWTLPTSLPIATDAYANYMTSALINQNNSMAIAKQQRDMGIVDAVAGGVMGAAGGIMSGGKGGIFGAIGSLFNMGSNIAKAQMAYENKQKTYDAQNAAAKATLVNQVNNTVDADTATQIMTSSLIPFATTKYQWMFNFNWGIPVKLPSLPSDIIFYNNLIYLNGFYVNQQIPISELIIKWDNGSKENAGDLPHIYIDIDMPQEIIKFHFKTLNLELLNAVTTLVNNGVRFWKNLPDYSRPWYWIHNPIVEV